MTEKIEPATWERASAVPTGQRSPADDPQPATGSGDHVPRKPAPTKPEPVYPDANNAGYEK